MLRVHYSNRTEDLVGALGRNLPETRASLFEPPALVVSNRPRDLNDPDRPNRLVSTYVQRELARARGVFGGVEVLHLRDLIERLAGATSRDRYFAKLLVALYDDELLDQEPLAPVRAYLHAGGEHRDALDRRRRQLASVLTDLYLDYARSRPDLLECWRAGLSVGEPRQRELEAWQRALWREVEPSIASDLDYARAPSAVHVFGLSHLARLELTFLEKLSRKCDVFVYTLNPCQEIWEELGEPGAPDAEAVKRYERRGRDLGPGEVFSVGDPFRLGSSGELTPLRLWSRPGRETLRLLNAVSGGELVASIHEPEPSSLLLKLQRDIALRKPALRPSAKASLPGPPDVEPSDQSVLVLECPDERRELEAIAAEIWRSLETRPNARFSDVALLLPPSVAARYRPLVREVFEEMGGLPLSLDEAPLAETRVWQAAELLFRLPLGRFSSRDVLAFATHPLAAGSSGGLGPELEASEASDWDGELERLALHDFPEISSNARFGLLVRSLLADLKSVTRVQLTLSAWMDFFSTLLATYLAPRAPADDRALARCASALAALAELDFGGRKLRYRMALDLVRDRVSEITLSEGRILSDGVTVSVLRPMKAVPHQIVFVAGLSERDFPRRRDAVTLESAGVLDLRGSTRRAGDLSPLAEDRFAFLETLLSARERLCLSYVARDPATGAGVGPSSLVLELEQTLVPAYVAKLPRKSVPFRRGDDPETVRVSARAMDEERARSLGVHLRGHAGRSRLGRLPELTLASSARAAVELSLEPSKERSPSGHVSGRPLSLSCLRVFVECPLQGSARWALGIEGDARDERAIRLVREAFRRGGTPERYDELTALYPSTDPFRRVLTSGRDEHLSILERWRRALQSLTSGDAHKMGYRKRRTLNLGSLDLELETNELFVLAEPHAALRLCAEPTARFHPQRESLRGFLEHVFLCASGLSSDEQPYTLVAVNAASDGSVHWEHFSFDAISEARARDYLTSLAEELQEEQHAYRLPCEEVFAGSARLCLDQTSSSRGPVPHAGDYPSLTPAQARPLIERRFGLYFEALASSSVQAPPRSSAGSPQVQNGRQTQPVSGSSRGG